LYNRDGVCLLRGTDWIFIYNSTFCPHSVFMCFCRYENKQRLFPYTALTDWFYNQEGVCLLRGTDWIFIYNSTFCPHSVFMCGSENKQRLFPYKTLTDWFV